MNDYRKLSKQRMSSKKKYLELVNELETENKSSFYKDFEIIRIVSVLKQFIIECDRELKRIDKSIGVNYRNGTYS